MSTPARIAHHTSGRIRIEVPSRRGDGAYFGALAEQLSQSGEVLRARGNPAAASLALEYRGPLEALLAQLERCSLQLSGAAPAAADLPVGFPFVSLPLSPMAMAGAAFGLVGLVQTARGQIMLPALSAFWYAASALRLARLPENGHSAVQAATQSNTILP